MSSDTATVDVPASDEATTHGEAHAHPSDLKYIKVAIFLAVVTALEVMTYIVDIGDALVPTLWIMMAIKFYAVAGYFMHLKFDSPLFTKLFVAGLAGAVAVYVVMLSAFQIWDEF